MKTDIYPINTKDDIASATRELERAARFCGLDEAGQQRLGALAQSMLQVSDGISYADDRKIWLESSDKEAVLHLTLDAAVDTDDEEELLALSTDGKNTRRKTVGGKIAGAFQELFIGQNEAAENGYYAYPDIYGAAETYPAVWSLSDYDQRHRDTWNDKAAGSVKRLADEVEIGLTSSEVEIAAAIQYS